MTFIEFKNLLKNKKKTIFSLIFIFVMIALVVSLSGSLKYTSSSKVLVVQSNSASSDSYALSRSNEYLGNLFSQVVYSGSFFHSVLNSSRYEIDESYFKGDYGEQLKVWNKTISTKTIADTGIIEIYVYHPNPNQAMIISMAVNDVLINENTNYQGGEGVKISVLNQAVVSDYPDKPNLLYNLVFALFLGLILSLVYIYLYPERKYDISLLPKGKTKSRKNRRVLAKSEKRESANSINKDKINSLDIKTVDRNSSKQNISKQNIVIEKNDEINLNDPIRDEIKGNNNYNYENKVKEELFASDVFEPQGDMKGLLK